MRILSRRTCRTCGVEKYLRCFYRTRTGHEYSCKPCRLAYMAEMRVLKAEQIKAYYAAYYRRPGMKERRLEQNRAWRQTPRGRVLRAESNRIYRAFKRVAA